MVAHEKRNPAQLFCAVPTRNDLALSSLLFPAQPTQKLGYPALIARKSAGMGKLRFGRIASTAAVRTRGDFGIIPSPLHLARSLIFRRQPIMNHSVVGACFLHELQIKTVQHGADGNAEQHP